MNKILSIIVPSYNMEAYLPKCLGSLVVEDSSDPNSSFSLLNSLDVIVVNDGSKDRTSEIAHEFERKYPGVFRVIDKENGHYGSCVNAGLAVAEGKYVKVLDADDYFDKAAFQRLLRRFADFIYKADEVDVVITDFLQVDSSGNAKSAVTFNACIEDCFTVDDIPVVIYHMHQLFYRTGLLIEMNYHQTEGVPYTDTEWISLPMAVAGRCRYVQESVYRYVLGREGQTVDESGTPADMFAYLKVFVGVVSRIASLPRVVNDRYLTAWLHAFAGSIYDTYIHKLSSRRVAKELMRMDAEIKDCSPRLYEWIGGNYVFYMIYNYYYLRQWRSRQRYVQLNIILSRAVFAAVSFVRTLMFPLVVVTRPVRHCGKA